MASALYSKAKEKFLSGSLDLLTDTIKVALVDSADYTPDTAADEFLSDIPAAGRVAISPALANKTVSGGVFDADDVTITGVSGDQFEYLVLFKDTGADTTSPLIAIFDTASGLPFTPSGGDVAIIWDSGANKIFAL